MLTPLDDALRVIHHYDHEYAGGMSNHAPMVAESLDHAGLDDAIAPWVASYVRRLDPREFTPGAAQPEVGDGAADRWTGYFLDQLQRRDWCEVVAEWSPRLVSGSAGAAGHGILRAAHAVRSLERGSSEDRMAELAHGLGYWAASFHAVPGRPATGSAGLGEALAAVPSTDSDGWFISQRLPAIDGRMFGPAVGAASLPADADEAISLVIDLALRVLATNPAGAIAFVHAVTVPACARHLLPYVADGERSVVADQAWWVLAAMWSTYGTEPPLVAVDRPPATWDALIAAALASGDEHDIKLTIAARDQCGRVDDALLRHAVGTVVGA